MPPRRVGQARLILKRPSLMQFVIHLFFHSYVALTSRCSSDPVLMISYGLEVNRETIGQLCLHQQTSVLAVISEQAQCAGS